VWATTRKRFSARYGCPIESEDRILIKLVKPTEMYMYTYGFGWRELETVSVSSIRQFVETLLNVSFNDVDVFRAITDQKIVHAERASFLDKVDF